MKIVIVGDGKMGFTLTRHLSEEGHDVTVIDHNAEILERTGDILDVACLRGDGISLAVLAEAGADECDLLIAVTSRDEVNIICCMLARKLGARHTIARVRNPEYAKSLFFIREELGLSMLINPEMDAATEIFRLLRFPTALKIDFLAKGRVELLTFRLTADSPLAGKALHALKSRVLVCTVQRDGAVYIPDGDFVLQGGDTISVTASPKDVAAFFHTTGIRGQKIKSVMIVGGGKISFYLARLLCESGLQVKILEKDKERCDLLSELLPRAMVICGDGSDQKLLMEEDLDRTDALVALTNMDEENVIISMFATLHEVGKVIAKINHISLDKILEKSGVDCTVTPHLISSNQIVQYVRAMQNSRGNGVESMVRLGSGAVEALEFHVKESFEACDVSLKTLALKKELLIASIIRGGKVIYPTGSDCIRAGDNVIVITMRQRLEDLNDILL